MTLDAGLDVECLFLDLDCLSKRGACHVVHFGMDGVISVRMSLLGSDASLVDVHFGMDDRWWVSGVISCTLAVLFLTPCPDPMMLDLWSMIEHSDFD